MRRATLLFNPHAGRNHKARLRTIERIAQALRNHSIETTIVSTEGPNTAGQQARALSETTDILFACGGDGTVHEVLQGIAFHSPHRSRHHPLRLR